MRGLLDDLEADDDIQLLTGGGRQNAIEEEGRAYITVSARGSERQQKETSPSEQATIGQPLS